MYRKALLTWDNSVCEERVIRGEGLTRMVNATKPARPFEVTADGKGMTGRAGLSLVAAR